MITKFQIFESNKKPKIGDYVYIYQEDFPNDIMNNTYGQIVNVDKTHKDTYLIHYLCDLTDKQKTSIIESGSDLDIKPKYKINFKDNEYYDWFHSDYLEFFDTKEELDVKIDSKKFNL